MTTYSRHPSQLRQTSSPAGAMEATPVGACGRSTLLIAGNWIGSASVRDTLAIVDSVGYKRLGTNFDNQTSTYADAVAAWQGRLVAMGSNMLDTTSGSPTTGDREGHVVIWWNQASGEWEPLGNAPAGRTTGFDVASSVERQGKLLNWDGKLVAAMRSRDTGDSGPYAWDGSSWGLVGDGLPSSTYAMATWNGSLVAAVHFSTVLLSGEPFSGVARLEGDTWVPVGHGDLPAGRKTCVFEWDGKLVVATAGGAIGTWDGTTYTAMPPFRDDDASTTVVQALTVWRGELYAGGAFRTANFGTPDAVQAWRIARWDADSGLWAPLPVNNGGVWNESLGGRPAVYAMAPWRTGFVVVGYFDRPWSFAAWFDGKGWHRIDWPDLPTSRVQDVATWWESST